MNLVQNYKQSKIATKTLVNNKLLEYGIEIIFKYQKDRNNKNLYTFGLIKGRKRFLSLYDVILLVIHNNDNWLDLTNEAEKKLLNLRIAIIKAKNKHDHSIGGVSWYINLIELRNIVEIMEQIRDDETAVNTILKEMTEEEFEIYSYYSTSIVPF